MLFSSYSFLFCFLPLALAAWQLTARAAAQPAQALAWLLLALSLVFYAFWGLGFLVLLLGLIVMNHAFGTALAAPQQEGGGTRRLSRKGLLVLALACNLLPLLWFKYAGFLVDCAARLCGTDWSFTPQGLPLGISFYTFIQIAWLVAVYRRETAPEGLAAHALFTSCFAWVISGPIVRYGQMGPQLGALAGLRAENLARGFTLLALGLGKKVLLADSIGAYADAVFNAASRGIWPSTLEAWLGSLAYTFQLYFDFSGYTDMALGLGLMLGLRLPENFASPYKATGIVDFWRRWHITLGAWLRDFLYIPLGGNRRGRLRQYANLFLTMLIGGAWHGAGWTFIIWGALHGAMLSVNHFFRACTRGTLAERLLAAAPGRLVCVVLTFFCIDLCWVVFRAPNLDTAMTIYTAMAGAGPDVWPPLMAPDAGAGLEGFLARLDPAAPESLMAALLPNRFFSGWLPFALLAVCGVIVWCCPNSQEVVFGPKEGAQPRVRWRPTTGWAAALAVLSFAALVLASRETVFLYFQF
ncbi:MAG: MBOAT family protein [Desulfovibrio sp.]|nr:MBOAT family protein [Desulfovibrio sp.]